MVNINNEIEKNLMRTLTLKQNDAIQSDVLILTSVIIRRSSIYNLYRQLNPNRWIRSRT